MFKLMVACLGLAVALLAQKSHAQILVDTAAYEYPAYGYYAAPAAAVAAPVSYVSSYTSPYASYAAYPYAYSYPFAYYK